MNVCAPDRHFDMLCPFFESGSLFFDVLVMRIMPIADRLPRVIEAFVLEVRRHAERIKSGSQGVPRLVEREVGDARQPTDPRFKSGPVDDRLTAGGRKHQTRSDTS